MSSSSKEEDDEVPTHQHYYIKATYSASYEAVLPISTTSKQQDINDEKCLEYMCVPIVTEPDPDTDQRIPIKCKEPKCPRGYMLHLEIQKDANQCAK